MVIRSIPESGNILLVQCMYAEHLSVVFRPEFKNVHLFFPCFFGTWVKPDYLLLRTLKYIFFLLSLRDATVFETGYSLEAAYEKSYYRFSHIAYVSFD